jgi:hypothetical protein
MKSTLISDFLTGEQAKLICVFEYLLPGIIWDEHNIVYMIQMNNYVCAYHYIHDDNKETREIFAINDFFHKRGIDIKETPINVVPPSFFSRVLFPSIDLGKPFYVPKKNNSLLEKLIVLFRCKEEIMLNPDISFIENIKKIHLRRKQYPSILLYQSIDDSGNEWQMDANW